MRSALRLLGLLCDLRESEIADLIRILRNDISEWTEGDWAECYFAEFNGAMVSGHLERSSTARCLTLGGMAVVWFSERNNALLHIGIMEISVYQEVNAIKEPNTYGAVVRLEDGVYAVRYEGSGQFTNTYGWLSSVNRKCLTWAALTKLHGQAIAVSEHKTDWDPFKEKK